MQRACWEMGKSAGKDISTWKYALDAYNLVTSYCAIPQKVREMPL